MRNRSTLYLILGLVVLFAPGCIWRAISKILPWHVAAESLTDKPEADIVECKKPERHCFDLASGGTCQHCGERCVLSPDAPAKPPVPIPIPDCDLEHHCNQVEKCKVIGGDCCTRCHQGCPVWSEDPNSPGELWHRDHCVDGKKHWCQNGTEHCCDGCRRICPPPGG